MLVVADIRNPTILTVAKTTQRLTTVMLNSNVTLVKVDGFNPQTDFLQIMKEVNLQTRGQPPTQTSEVFDPSRFIE